MGFTRSSLQAPDTAGWHPSGWSAHTNSLDTVLGDDPQHLGQQQSRLRYNGRAHLAHTRGVPGAPSSGDQGACASGPPGDAYYT